MTSAILIYALRYSKYNIIKIILKNEILDRRTKYTVNPVPNNLSCIYETFLGNSAYYFKLKENINHTPLVQKVFILLILRCVWQDKKLQGAEHYKPAINKEIIPKLINETENERLFDNILNSEETVEKLCKEIGGDEKLLDTLFAFEKEDDPSVIEDTKKLILEIREAIINRREKLLNTPVKLIDIQKELSENYEDYLSIKQAGSNHIIVLFKSLDLLETKKVKAITSPMIMEYSKKYFLVSQNRIASSVYNRTHNNHNNDHNIKQKMLDKLETSSTEISTQECVDKLEENGSDYILLISGMDTYESIVQSLGLPCSSKTLHVVEGRDINGCKLGSLYTIKENEAFLVQREDLKLVRSIIKEKLFKVQETEDEKHEKKVVITLNEEIDLYFSEDFSCFKIELPKRVKHGITLMHP